MANPKRLTADDIATASTLSLVSMLGAWVMLAGAGVAYQGSYRFLAIIGLIAAVVGLILWIGSFVIVALERSDAEFERLALVFAGGFALVGILLLHPFLSFNEFAKRPGGDIWADLAGFWGAIGFLDMALIAAALVVSACVCAFIGHEINAAIAFTALGTGFLFIIVVAIALIAAAMVFAMAVLGALAMIAALSRAIQGN